MGVKTETRYVFTCDRCPNEGGFDGWGTAVGAGWRKVAVFTDVAADTDDLGWDLLCPDDAAQLRAWLGNAERGLM